MKNDEDKILKAEKAVAPLKRLAITKRLSVCECGFTLLDDSIPLGTEYTIIPTTREADLCCGGCGKHQAVTTVYALSRSGGIGGWIPIKIFED